MLLQILTLKVMEVSRVNMSPWLEVDTVIPHLSDCAKPHWGINQHSITSSRVLCLWVDCWNFFYEDIIFNNERFSWSIQVLLVVFFFLSQLPPWMKELALALSLWARWVNCQASVYWALVRTTEAGWSPPQVLSPGGGYSGTQTLWLQSPPRKIIPFLQWLFLCFHPGV